MVLDSSLLVNSTDTPIQHYETCHPMIVCVNLLNGVLGLAIKTAPSKISSFSNRCLATFVILSCMHYILKLRCSATVSSKHRQARVFCKVHVAWRLAGCRVEMRILVLRLLMITTGPVSNRQTGGSEDVTLEFLHRHVVFIDVLFDIRVCAHPELI